jgi:nitrate reductase beta subunit
LDDFSVSEFIKNKGYWQNKYGVQAGFKSFDVFKVNNLNFQTEFNYVRPYTYSHGTAQQSYSHMNQPLAHPVGANFMESVTIVNYKYKRLFFESKCSYVVYGIDTAGSDYGKNIFISYTKRQYEYDNRVGQGIKTHLVNIGLKTAWIADANANLRLELGVNYRLQKNVFATVQTPFVYFGIKTDLFNRNEDF